MVLDQFEFTEKCDGKISQCHFTLEHRISGSLSDAIRH